MHGNPKLVQFMYSPDIDMTMDRAVDINEENFHRT